MNNREVLLDIFLKDDQNVEEWLNLVVGEAVTCNCPCADDLFVNLSDSSEFTPNDATLLLKWVRQTVEHECISASFWKEKFDQLILESICTQ